MKKNLNFSALLVLIVLASCQKDISNEQPVLISEASAGSQRDLFVSVKFISNGVVNADRDPSSATYPYVHNKERVQAVIWAAGEFFMNTNTTSSKAPVRKIIFNVANAPLSLNDVNNVRMRVVQVEGGTRLQDIEPGQPKQAKFWFWGEKPSGTFVWKLYYRGNKLFDDPLSVDVTVSRELNGSWTIKSNGDGKALLRNQQDQDLGHFLVPFELNITAL